MTNERRRTSPPERPAAPKPRTQPSDEFRKIEEWAEANLKTAPILIKAVYQARHDTKDVLAQMGALQAIDALTWRHVQRFNPTLAALLEGAVIREFLDWLVSDQDVAGLIGRITRIEIRSLKARHGPRKAKDSPDALNLLIGYGAFATLLGKLRGVPTDERRRVLAESLLRLSRRLGYVKPPPDAATLDHYLSGGEWLKKPPQGALALLEHFTGYEHDTLAKYVARARRLPLADLLGLA